MGFMHSFEKVSRSKLSESDKEDINNQIGVVAELAAACCSAAATTSLGEINSECLMRSAEHFCELIGELNALVQT